MRDLEACKLVTACSVIVGVPIFVFDVIGLCQAWNPAVFAACGHQLPNFVIACLVLPFAIWLLYMVICDFLLIVQNVDWGCVACAVFVGSVIMWVLGFQFSAEANANPYCIGNLTDTGFIKSTTPVLVVMGYMHANVFLVAAFISFMSNIKCDGN